MLTSFQCLKLAIFYAFTYLDIGLGCLETNVEFSDSNVLQNLFAILISINFATF